MTVAGTMDFKLTVSFLRKEDSLARELVITAVAIMVFGGMGVLLLYSSIKFPGFNPPQKTVDICKEKSPGDTVVFTTQSGFNIRFVCAPIGDRLEAVPLEWNE